MCLKSTRTANDAEAGIVVVIATIIETAPENVAVAPGVEEAALGLAAPGEARSANIALSANEVN
jgi:hypothetical protein